MVSSFSLFYHFHTQGLTLFCWVSPVMEVVRRWAYMGVVEQQGSMQTQEEKESNALTVVVTFS